ncbi:MAG TPA: ATP-binding protein [Anaeromyxobacteraceae bacterium]|nr:ATP-binding protein [Anaeromyxobacteraceae bacterium]
MTLRGKVVALVVGLTATILAGLGVYLASSWSGWSREAVERDLSRRISSIASLVEVKKDGRLELEDEGSPLLDDPAHPFRILGPSFSASNGELGRAWPDPEERVVAVMDGRGRTWTVMTRFVAPRGKHADRFGDSVRLAIQVAGMEAPFGPLEERFRRGLLAALAAALVLGGGGAALLAHVAFAPLRRLASETDSIGASSLDRRIGSERLDPELRRVASSFNALLARLEEAMQRQRAFVSRASHALRTPTATILTRAEVALRRERAPAEYRAALDEIAAAARESATLVAHLLTLARLDDRRGALQLEDVALLAIASELSRLLSPRADEAGLSLECDVASELTVRADRAALRELLEALLDNAIRYTPRGGRVGLRARKDGVGVLLVVWDTGPGIPPEERGLVFERFHRGSAAAASGAPGSGLGLAIVKTIADAHGATLSLTDHPGGGLQVTMRLA